MYNMLRRKRNGHPITLLSGPIVFSNKPDSSVCVLSLFILDPSLYSMCHTSVHHHGKRQHNRKTIKSKIKIMKLSQTRRRNVMDVVSVVK